MTDISEGAMHLIHRVCLTACLLVAVIASVAGAAEHDELRFDGITSRSEAIRMLEERVRTGRRGAWIVTVVAAKIPHFSQNEWSGNSRKLVSMPNSMGVTAWIDAGGRGMGAKHYEPYRYLTERGELKIQAPDHYAGAGVDCAYAQQRVLPVSGRQSGLHPGGKICRYSGARS